MKLSRVRESVTYSLTFSLRQRSRRRSKSCKLVHFLTAFDVYYMEVVPARAASCQSYTENHARFTIFAA